MSTYFATSRYPSLYLNAYSGGPGGTIYWQIVNSAGVAAGGQVVLANIPGYLSENNEFSLAAICTLYVAASGNYNFNVSHNDGCIFAIEGTTVVSGPANDNPAGQTETPLAGLSFGASSWSSGIPAVAAGHNVGIGFTPITDSYVVNFPASGYYQMEFGWNVFDNLEGSGGIQFLTGSSGTVNIPPVTSGVAPVAGVVYLTGVVAWVLFLNPGTGTYGPTYAEYGGIPIGYGGGSDSQLVFPAPAGFWTWPVKQTPVYNTIVQKSTSARSFARIPTMYYPTWEFTIDISYLKGDNQGVNTMWQTFVNFFMGVLGQGSSWLFQHPYDYSVTNMQFGTGDGVTTVFPITRSFITGGAPDLIQNFIATPTISVNGSVVSNYAIDTYGNCIFTSAPTSGYAITWSGEFYFRCTFLDDEMKDLEEFVFQAWSCSELKFRSILL